MVCAAGVSQPVSARTSEGPNGRIFIGIGETFGGADMLGIWFSPLAIAVGALLYFALTWAFGRVTIGNNKVAKR